MYTNALRIKGTNMRNEDYSNNGIDLPSLQEVVFNEWAFANCHLVIIESMYDGIF